jgi:hypothetical protein
MSFILEGEGKANKIAQEAKAFCESIEEIAQSLEKSDNLDALRFKLAEQYISAMGEVL